MPPWRHYQDSRWNLPGFGHHARRQGGPAMGLQFVSTKTWTAAMLS